MNPKELELQAARSEVSLLDKLVATRAIPDALIRVGIRRILKQRLNEINGDDLENFSKNQQALVSELKSGPIAIATDLANDQHYQVPSEFFRNVLGPHLKYSCGLWPAGVEDLGQSEATMLDLTVKRAKLVDGENILELGCGWGSLTLYMAERFPNSKITALSNSRTQREYITQVARERGLHNIEIITADVSVFDAIELKGRFDRVVSVEMFEHMRNYEALLAKIATWMKPQATLFVHIFCHQKAAYKYEVKDQSDWMAKYFFSGGMMPSEHLFYHFQKDLVIREKNVVSGTHYAKTCLAWLREMDQKEERLMPLFEAHYKDEARKFWCYWRLFFMACEELFAYDKGAQWYVSHYLFEQRG